MPGDVAILKVMPPAIRENRVLPAEERQLRNTTRSASIRIASACPTRAGGVLEGQILPP